LRALHLSAFSSKFIYFVMSNFINSVRERCCPEKVGSKTTLRMVFKNEFPSAAESR
jgi:hypothetical protein